MSVPGADPGVPGDQPKTSRVRAAIIVAVGLSISGVLVGALWSWLAPPAHGVVALTRSGNRVHAYLGAQAGNLFIAPFLLIGFLMVLAAVAAVAVWQWQAHRGPLLIGALVIGAIGSAATAAGTGALLAHWRFGGIDIAGAPVTPEHRVHYVVEAPPVFFGHSGWQIAATLVAGAAVAGLFYALAAVSIARDDLGAWPPVDRPQVLVTADVTADGGPPSAP